MGTPLWGHHQIQRILALESKLLALVLNPVVALELMSQLLPPVRACLAALGQGEGRHELSYASVVRCFVILVSS